MSNSGLGPPVESKRQSSFRQSRRYLADEADQNSRKSPSDGLATEIAGGRLEQAKPLEVFVDKTKDRILLVDGRVRITIMIG